MAHLRLLGDIHGDYPKYKSLLPGTEYSLQVGDMGFDYGPLADIDPTRHLFLPGNHEGYHKELVEDMELSDIEDQDLRFYFILDTRTVYRYIRLPPHFLGHYGKWHVPGTQPGEMSGDLFYVRGGYSIDRKYRTFGVDWFHEEELSVREFHKIHELYRRTKPDFVVSHDCPLHIYPYLTNPTWGIGYTITNQGLQAMFEIHQPKLWVFGHHHKTWRMQVGQTLFICLNINQTLDFDDNLRIIE